MYDLFMNRKNSDVGIAVPSIDAPTVEMPINGSVCRDQLIKHATPPIRKLLGRRRRLSNLRYNGLQRTGGHMRIKRKNPAPAIEEGTGPAP